MWILPLIGYAGVIVGFAFLTLAIASGLYYLSELVEEHTVIARRILSRLIYGVIITQILLWLLDSFPLTLSLLSIFSHLVYASNLRKFPIVKLSDPLFIFSCFLVCLNHWVWFRHFSDPAALSSRRSFSSTSSRDATAWRRPYQPDYENMPTFTEVASYFGLCVWLVPFALFVSLSAGDNVLPSMGSEYATGGNAHPSSSSSSALPEGGRNKNVGLAKALVDRVREWASESGELLGFYKGDRTRRFL